ncbi:MAG TPA: AbrB/MazE/SpoVT family DNA-binding domain-containing protein [Verrucomicrobiae bacterium]|jgi:AbrB family looped-hinge helix DNA binding protein|nr:AbrB/MazE/SpoVT family DNA-binding domain-containing protein [Verrucomicrobiae bacterium]
MKELNIPIDGAGRIVLPKNVREELAIKPGDLLKVAIHGSAVTLTPNNKASGLVRKGKALVFSPPNEDSLDNRTVNDILQNVRDERDFQSFPTPQRGRKKA